MRKGLSLLAVIVACASTASLPARALAWGKTGHEIAGRIADKYLDERARTAIKALLRGDQFHSLSDGQLNTWADAIRSSAAFKRKYPKMSQWHYINIDVNADPDELDLAQYRKGGDNVLDAILKLREVLKDTTQPIQDRREALFFIAHFIEDLHQPLHCVDRNGDRGGNLVRVRLPGEDGREANLHSVWDTPLVEEAVGRFTVADYAGRLTNALSAEQRMAMQKGTVADWVAEGYKLAREKVYKDKGVALPTDRDARHTLSRDYVTGGAEVVEGQLTRAGLRLAQFLNDTFKD
jgi:nuclease S1